MNSLATPPVLRVQGLSKRFVARRDWLGRPVQQVHAVNDVSFEIAPGEILGLVGESGCGKTTLSRMLVKLVAPSEGTIKLGGVDVTALSEREFAPHRRHVQMIFQDPYASLDPRMTVSDTIGEGLLNFGLARTRREAAGLAADYLAKVGLRPDQAGRFPHEFSGGQRQRIGIARALSVAPSLVVCDEPVSALDVSVQAQVVNLLLSLQAATAVSYLFVSHDLAVVRHISDRVIVMYLGRIVEDAPVATIFSRPAHPYSVALLESTPKLQPGRRRPRPAELAGEIASPLNPPTGCGFHPRCPHAQDICRTQAPPLRPRAATHRVACHFDLN